MRKYLFPLVLLLAFACREDGLKVCADDPVNDLPWLKEQIDEINKSSLREYYRMEQAEYDGMIVFFASNGCPFCNTITLYYDCDGNQVDPVDATKLKNIKTIWTP